MYGSISPSASMHIRVAPSPEAALGDWSCREPVAVAIPDITRPLNCVPALHALRRRLVGGMTVVVGLGLHRRMTDAELAELKGKTDTKSKARRNALKEYRADLGTMSIAEAKAKRDKAPAKAQEVEVETFLYVSGRHPNDDHGLDAVNVDDSKLSRQFV